MSTFTLTTASRLFAERRYQEALPAYRTAKELYGLRFIDGLIAICEAKVAARARAVAPLTLDPATEYMLLRERSDTASEQRKSVLLSQFAERTRERSRALPTRTVRTVPPEWPQELALRALPQSTNDFDWMLERAQGSRWPVTKRGLSVVVPTYNRSQILSITLACLANQETDYEFEVIVADDGSKEDIQGVVRQFESVLDIKHVRHADTGYRLCAVRNFGVRASVYDWVAILDCDMAPSRTWVQSYCELLAQSSEWALIGPRKYVDTNGLAHELFLKEPNLVSSLPEVRTNNAVAGKEAGEISVDWRLEHFEKTDRLRLCDTPFRFFSGGNVAFHREWIERAGSFDEDFAAWGGEDNEFGYRLYRAGCYFRYVGGALAYHQEPPGKENETDRELGHKITRQMVVDRVPYVYRMPQGLKNAVLHKAPLVSIYIPAYNAESSIERAIESALNQTVVDLEVCVCDDGSTDNTLKILEHRYGRHPRLRFVSQPNGGIGRASNTALRLTRGFYVGQLDSDDRLMPDAVEHCLKAFLENPRLACVYTGNENLNKSDGTATPGYNWPEFSRQKLTCAMIAHHFRMFTARAWHLTAGFAEDIKNAVDYDMYLKLSEVGEFKHLNVMAYTRVLHGSNTSLTASGAQKRNHLIAVNRSLERQGITDWEAVAVNELDDVNRSVKFIRRGRAK
jgi:chondroitin synthase